MSILITGSSGYIGSQLCKQYETEPSVKEVVGLDLAPPKQKFSKVMFYDQDCNSDLSNIFDKHKIDTVIHLVYVLDPLHDSEKMYRINVGSMENILKFADKYNVKRIVVTSSATAYGAHPDNPDWIKEEQPLRRNQSYQYAREKTTVEEKLRAYEKSHPDVEIVIARPAVGCGANISNFISRYVSKSLVPLPKDLNVESQFIHEKDIARALYCLATEASPGVYNLGPPNTIASAELVEMMGGKAIYLSGGLLRAMTALAWTLRIRSLTEAPSSMIDFIEYSWVVDGSKVEQETSFRYQYTSTDAVRDFAEAQTA